MNFEKGKYQSKRCCYRLNHENRFSHFDQRIKANFTLFQVLYIFAKSKHLKGRLKL